jgi:hypothetical protein
MENCMINPPDEEWFPGCDDDEDDPLDAFSDDEISLYMTDRGEEESEIERARRLPPV